MLAHRLRIVYARHFENCTAPPPTALEAWLLAMIDRFLRREFEAELKAARKD
jgi:hypothetical protein